MFKALKQTVRIKTFASTSAKALLIQRETAWIAMLPVKQRQMRSRYGRSLSNLVVLVRQQLFVYHDLPRWLDDPLQASPQPPRVEQPVLD
ncbi:MAG: hypothetical protein ACPL7M_08225 [Bryobacteraceae bacterium]